MPKLPKITASELLRALHRDGWYQVGQEGSHVQLKHAAKKGKVTVGVHSSKTIPTYNLASVLKQAGLSADELRELL